MDIQRRGEGENKIPQVLAELVSNQNTHDSKLHISWTGFQMLTWAVWD